MKHNVCHSDTLEKKKRINFVLMVKILDKFVFMLYYVSNTKIIRKWLHVNTFFQTAITFMI